MREFGEREMIQPNKSPYIIIIIIIKSPIIDHPPVLFSLASWQSTYQQEKNEIVIIKKLRFCLVP